MATISYDFQPGETVWCIVDNPPYVQEAVVKQVSIVSVLPTIVPTIEYQVQYTGRGGSAQLPDTDVFGDVDTALTEYRTRIIV